MSRPLLVVAVILWLAPAAPAAAQSDAFIGFGLAFSTYDSRDDILATPNSVGPLLRLQLGEGLGPSIGFQWFRTDVRTVIGGRVTRLGSLRMRPIMAGVAYTKRFGRFTAATALVGGYAFARLRLDDAARAAAYRHDGSVWLSGRAGDSFAWRPNVSLWYDVGQKVGLLASLAYIGVRPTITISTTAGPIREHVNADSVVFTVGAVYGIF